MKIKINRENKNRVPKIKYLSKKDKQYVSARQAIRIGKLWLKLIGGKTDEQIAAMPINDFLDWLVINYGQWMVDSVNAELEKRS